QAMLEWFDYYLRGNEQADVSAYIQTYDLGAAKWTTRDHWPPETTDIRFEFTDFEQANSCEGGRLQRLPQVAPTALDEAHAALDEAPAALDEAPAAQDEKTAAEEALATGNSGEASGQGASEGAEGSDSLDRITYYYDPRNPVPSRG